MFRIGAKMWHRGTLVVKTGQGERTITHLQSLSLPNSHYYFNRPLADEQAVGLAAGQIDPATIPGYVGRVSPVEALCPIWNDTKHALIKTQLYWLSSASQAEKCPGVTADNGTELGLPFQKEGASTDFPRTASEVCFKHSNMEI